ncbi:MAG: AAA family ATPase [Candidatus Paceibacterota bacterium]|jgi:ATP-dependent Clp protease ATP-binding subunit ClpC
MDISQLVKNSPLYPILILESVLSNRVRSWMIKISGGLFVVLVVLAAFFSFSGLSSLAPKVWGLIFVSLAFYLFAKMTEFYFNSSYYFDNVALNRYRPGDIFTFTVGRILLGVQNDDVLEGFLLSKVGRRVIRRCGLSDRATNEFLNHRGPAVFYKLPLNSDGVLKLRDLVKFLFENDSAFAQWLSEAEINETELIGAVGWVVYEIEYGEYRKRWWSESNLAKLPGIAKDWGFGNTYTLDKYSWDLIFGLSYSSADYEYSTRSDEIAQIENILAKQKEANVFIVADSASERMDVVWHLVRQIRDGVAPPALEHKRPVLFNTAVFLAHFKDRSSLETELLKILNEAGKAGNIILVFDNFAGLLQGMTALGTDFVSLIYPALTSNSIQVIGLSSNDDFHHLLETNATLMTTFDRIFIRPLPEESIIHNLEQTVWQIEKKNRLFFTYPALLEIVRDANRYFTESDSGDKAVDLLVEIIPWAQSRSYKVISQTEVEEMVQTKTGIPIGKLQPAERENLMALEKNLHARVVGQDEAIVSVSNALRRARAGVRNAERPIGSFLFLGPTGVGKTETSKALAEVMFGQETKMVRLDMSEYQTSDAVAKLIGSFSSGKPGILADLVRESPYGVLLLDEFEKTNPDVLDIFLQILDEGFFSDKEGKRVSLRNLIIIATSNAGADLIWQMVKSGIKPQDKVDDLVNHIVEKGIFKPELLNRFDAVVIFHPLQFDELNQIALLMLNKLAKRLINQGVTLEINDIMVKAVAELGANEVFGARPMQRFIQDNIEQQVADAIIKGVVRSGSIVSFIASSNLNDKRPQLAVKKL